jgi:hypothetical protein
LNVPSSLDRFGDVTSGELVRLVKSNGHLLSRSGIGSVEAKISLHKSISFEQDKDR